MVLGEKSPRELRGAKRQTVPVPRASAAGLFSLHGLSQNGFAQVGPKSLPFYSPSSSRTPWEDQWRTVEPRFSSKTSWRHQPSECGARAETCILIISVEGEEVGETGGKMQEEAGVGGNPVEREGARTENWN